MVAGTQTAAASTGEVTDAPDSASVPNRARQQCCTLYHQAVELVGKRWTGAILIVLLDGPLRFSEIKHLVPDLSDRLLSERLKELEAEGIVQRRCENGGAAKVEYVLTSKGQALEPAVRALKSWAHSYL